MLYGTYTKTWEYNSVFSYYNIKYYVHITKKKNCHITEEKLSHNKELNGTYAEIRGISEG